MTVVEIKIFVSPRARILHNLFFFRAFHFAVQQSDFVLRKNFIAQFFITFSSPLSNPFFPILQSADKRCKPAAEIYFALDSFINAVAFVFADDDGFNRRSAGRQLVNHRNVQIAVNRHRQTSRNRRRGHHQNVGLKPRARSSARCITPKRCCSSTTAKPSFSNSTAS
jgi:hypothetical protein